MNEQKDGFIRELDKEKCGIDGKCRAVVKIMSVVDPLVHRKLIEEKVLPQFYALRWIMLLLCQEFDMINAIRLWDSLLADEKRFEFLRFVSDALNVGVRD